MRLHRRWLDCRLVRIKVVDVVVHQWPLEWLLVGVGGDVIEDGTKVNGHMVWVG